MNQISAIKNGEVRCPMVGLWGLIIILFCYVLYGALKPRVSLQYTFISGYPVGTGVDIEYFNPIEWLPLSYDCYRTKRAFWK